ncbi:molybdenum cofactor biosynthesis protein B [Halobacteriales archaeon SW_7_65_23]|nr:MAG: molybdenum cofactor biosynthesis protein B [Halobacteriales archaeon SW_7_65_23]
MVDFQSRDTRRGIGDDDEDDEEEPEPEAEPDEPDDEAAPAKTDSPAEEPPAEAAAPTTDDGTTAYAVVTVTDERSLSEDTQGDVVVSAIEEGGGGIVTRDLVRPGYDGLQTTITTLAGRRDVDVVVTIGGTGVEPDDVTVDALETLLDKHLSGFGELFRLLAHETEGTAVVGTRTTAGIIESTPVFAVPGTVEGARTAVSEVVVEEAPHLAEDAADQEPDSSS